MADNQSIETIKAIGAIVTPIVLAWIAYLQIKMGKKQTEIHHQINGMQEKLLTATGDARQAAGELKGAADNQAITDAKEQDKK